ncbi:MAG: response regulator, partial [Myxococcales bacterium]
DSAYRVLEASSGAEALHVARTQAPQVILLDWMLPDMRAPAVLQELQKDERTRFIPVVLCTARRLEGVDERLAQGHQLLPKGALTRELLLQRVQEAMLHAATRAAAQEAS